VQQELPVGQQRSFELNPKSKCAQPIASTLHNSK